MLRAVAPLLLLAACTSSAPSVTPSAPDPASGTIEPDSSGSALPATPAPTAAAAWEMLDDAPFARLEMATALHDGRIWLAGGLSPLGEALTDVEIYDPATGEWSEGPSLPTGVHHAALASDGERLLLIGGSFGAEGQPTDLVLVLLDPGGEWEEGPPLPEPRTAGAAAFDGDRIVFAGGVGPADVAADVYALAGDAWEQIGSMARARQHLAATSDGAGAVWLLGGRVVGLESNIADVELVTADGIEPIGTLPTARGGVAAFHVEGLGGCLTGGEAPDQAYTVVECVADDGTITTLPELNEPHHGHGAALVNGVVYVLLGGPEPRLSASATVESLTLAP